MRRLLAIVVGIAALSIASSGASRPSPSHTAHHHPSHVLRPLTGHAITFAQTAPGLSVAVDGARHPDAIPEERAYAHFLSAMATASAKVRDVALGQAGLDEHERAAFAVALGSLGTELAQIAVEARTTKSFVRFQEQQRIAFQNARVRVDAALTADAREGLNIYIDTNVKRRIKIFRGQ